jgi:hypothetical protein
MSGGIGGVSVGMPELMILLFIVVPWLLAIAAGAWALITLYKMRASLERIEQHLRTR